MCKKIGDFPFTPFTRPKSKENQWFLGEGKFSSFHPSFTFPSPSLSGPPAKLEDVLRVLDGEIVEVKKIGEEAE